MLVYVERGVHDAALDAFVFNSPRVLNDLLCSCLCICTRTFFTGRLSTFDVQHCGLAHLFVVSGFLVVSVGYLFDALWLDLMTSLKSRCFANLSKKFRNSQHYARVYGCKPRLLSCGMLHVQISQTLRFRSFCFKATHGSAITGLHRRGNLLDVIL